MKRTLWIILRLVIAAAGIGYILYSITWQDQVIEGELRQGVWTIVKQADPRLLIMGLLLVGIIPPVQAMRWWLLMRCRGIAVTYLRALRLTMVGLFFNFCMPGMTGGDVVKAYYATRSTDKRGAAIMSVVFDRLTGLVALIVLAAAAGLTILDHALAGRVTLATWTILIFIAVAAMFYFAPAVRRATGLGHLLTKWQLIKRLDAAAVAYHHHKRTLLMAFALSIIVHICQITATALAGYAMGMSLPMSLLLTVLPVVLFAGALPMTYQGLGVMEALAVAMLVTEGAAATNQVIAMLVFFRLYLLAYSLLGSFILLRGDIRLHPAEK